jgi:xanthine dehydrogenase YagR molybdenum-binding subunit
LSVAGVIAVLTHKNRPPMAGTDRAYRDDTAPEGGSPFRPLYDDKIRFSGQPIAPVLAETARFAASLVRVNAEYAPAVDALRLALEIDPDYGSVTTPWR